MKLLSHVGSIAVLVAGSFSSTVFAQTTANGPYYATPSWDQTLPASTRFIVLSNMNSDAVLDRETGLVWEKSPNTGAGAGNDPIDWHAGGFLCLRKNVGGRTGWRLPSIHELASLFDPSAAFPPATLPPGHPFINVEQVYWSATTIADTPGSAWMVGFNGLGANLNAKTVPHSIWCVRGGGVLDNY
ncbi:MAG TPA: DUF1566 domain-containing protein [Burkholderiales bacterium]|nr:DUF1566 domain-containing protein [Burkholderiales bacterium]